MSLDVTLIETKSEDVFEFNITHNLTEMAKAAGLYSAMWRPEEFGLETASHLIPLLEAGLNRLMAKPERFKKLNPENGFGSYEGLLRTVRRYLAACKDHPDAKVWACR